jgi:hypothetical protein
MRRIVTAGLAATLGLAGLVATAAPSAAANGTIQVSVSAGSLTAVASASLAAFDGADSLQVSSPSSGTVRVQIWDELDDKAGPALLWSSDPNCTVAGATSPVSVITCTATKASVNFSSASVKTFTVVTDATPLSFIGGSGPDEVYGGAGADNLAGGDGDDDLFGGRGDDVIAGDAGNDDIEGEQGNDQMRAGTGNDDIVSAEEVAEKDNLVECGTASGLDTLDIDPFLDVTRNCQGVGSAAAPANVRATGTINSSANAIINATWTASPGADAYQIDYSTDGGASWVSVTRVKAPALASWNAGSMRGNVTLRVSAVKSNAVSSGVLSNTFALGTAVDTPTEVKANGWANEETLDNGFRLAWKIAQAPTSFDVQYRLCASAGSCGDWTSATVTGAATSADYTVMSPGSYEVRIRAVGTAGAVSNWAATSANVPTGRVTTVTGVNAWGSSDAFMVLWVSSTLATKWLKGYRIQMQYNDPNGTVSQWEDVRETSGSRTAIRLTTKSLGTKSGDIVRFRVITVPVYGADSRASNPSPRRQQTDAVPAPTDFAATYDAVTDYLTMTWKNPVITVNGGANVGGYDFAYMWPGSTTWTQLGSPLSYDSERAVFSLENVPRGTFKVRIRSIGWPDSLYSDWTMTRSVRK